MNHASVSLYFYTRIYLDSCRHSDDLCPPLRSSPPRRWNQRHTPRRISELIATQSGSCRIATGSAIYWDRYKTEGSELQQEIDGMRRAMANGDLWFVTLECSLEPGCEPVFPGEE